MPADPNPWMRRAAIALAAMLAVLGVAGYAGARLLKGKVLAALGPGAEIGALSVGPRGVVIENLRMPAPHGWPGKDAARIGRVRVAPDLRALLGGRLYVAAIEVQHAYLSIRRTGDGGLQMLPGLARAPRGDGSSPAAQVQIGRVELEDGELDFIDETLPRGPLTLHLKDVHARIDELDIPQLQARTRLSLDGVLTGPQHDGQVHLDGWMQLASRDSQLTSALRGVDLDALGPYLQKDGSSGSQHGLMDLDLDSRVAFRHLHAPGKLRLSQLSFSGGGSMLGMPRTALLNFVETHHEHLDISFELDGDLDNPKFSLNENIATRVALATAQALGVSIEDVAKGVGTLGSKSVDALKGVGSGIGGLLGIGKKDPPQK